MGYRTGILLLVLLWLLLPLADQAGAQVVPVGEFQEEQVRLQQLLYGAEFSSMTSLPLWQGTYDRYMERSEGLSGWWNRKVSPPVAEIDPGLGRDFNIRAGIYEPVVGNTFNTEFPSGINNASAWYGAGLTSEFKAGLWITSDYLTVTFRPHLTWQQNTDFPAPRFVTENGEEGLFYEAEGIGELIDAPYRFGPDPFGTADWGYSSIRVHYEGIEAGLSTEPLWWGGNLRYPLVMSNNAPGMRHFFIGTRSPLTIPYVGNLEFRWMGGFPNDSDYYTRFEEFQRDRFMNALNFSLTPALSTNFTVGFTRVIHAYKYQHASRELVTRIFDPVWQKNIDPEEREASPVFELASLYLRWVWPESRTEIFAEFYTQGDHWDSRDFLTNPRHDGGYAFGFQTLFDTREFWRTRYLRLHLELTNMTPSGLELVRPQAYTYTDPDNRFGQGHTNRGQVLGAAIGPGSNNQFMQLDLLTENGRFGVYAQRLTDNNHFHYQWNDPIYWGWGPWADWFRHRVDLTLGTSFLYMIESWVVTGKLAWTKLYNYGRYDYGDLSYWHATADFEFDEYNVKAQLSIRYTF